MSETATEPTTQTEDERGKLLRKAYGEATAALRESNREEFDRLYAEKAKALGVDYTPKPTAEQKAEQQLKELLAAHPHLAEKVRAGEEQVKEFTTNA